MPSIISKLFHKTHIPGLTDGLTQDQREAIVDILNYSMYADNFIALDEDAFIADTERKMHWDSKIDFDIYEEQSIGFVRRAKDDLGYREEFFDSVKNRLGDGATKKKALGLCEHLLALGSDDSRKKSAKTLELIRNSLA